MKKTIILSENAFKKIKRYMIQEAVSSNPYLFGTANEDYKRILEGLSKVSNLRTDRYKNYDLEEAYEKWSKVGFDKNTKEFAAWNGILKSYLNFLNGGIEYVLNDKVNRIGMNRPHWVFIDPSWAKDVILNHEGEKHQSIYSLILKIYQNKVMWNDLFFNPLFENIKNDFFKIKSFIGKALGENMNLKLLLPIEEYREINNFIRSGEAKPELFCNVESNQVDNIDDEDDF